jgi:hypothetical protein
MTYNLYKTLEVFEVRVDFNLIFFLFEFSARVL